MFKLHHGDSVNAIGAIEGGTSAREGIAASFTCNSVIESQRARAASVRFTCAKSSDIRAAIPFFGMAYFADHDLPVPMTARMILTGKNFKIFGTVIELIAVYMVNIFVMEKGTPNKILHNHAMFITPLILAPYFRGKHYIAIRNGFPAPKKRVVFAYAIPFVHVI